MMGILQNRFFIDNRSDPFYMCSFILNPGILGAHIIQIYRKPDIERR